MAIEKKYLFDGNLTSEIPLLSRIAHGIPGSGQVGAGNTTFKDVLRQTGTTIVVRETLNNEEKSIVIPVNSYVVNIDFLNVSGIGTVQAGKSAGLDDALASSEPDFNSVVIKFPLGGNLFLKAIGCEAKVNVSYKLNYF